MYTTHSIKIECSKSVPRELDEPMGVLVNYLYSTEFIKPDSTLYISYSKVFNGIKFVMVAVPLSGNQKYYSRVYKSNSSSFNIIEEGTSEEGLYNNNKDLVSSISKILEIKDRGTRSKEVNRLDVEGFFNFVDSFLISKYKVSVE